MISVPERSVSGQSMTVLPLKSTMPGWMCEDLGLACSDN